MGQRAGDTCGGRPRWGAVVVAAALVLAGCGGDDPDDGSAADAAPSTTAPAATGSSTDGAPSAEPGESPGTMTTTTTSAPLPEGQVAVPPDDELVERLPRLSVGDPQVSTDVGFDERLCTGRKGPAVPKGQARATYELTDIDQVTVAAYRFVDDGAALYLASWVEAVRSCARDAGPVEPLPVPDTFGSAFSLVTERGEAYVVAVLQKEVLWIMFIETTEPPLAVDPDTVDTFVRAVVG